MKRKLLVFLAITMILAIFVPAMSVMAVEPQWVYECNKLVIPVTIDGKIDGNEWDDAVGFTANNDNPVFQQFGIWQGSEDRPIASSELSVDYKIKWDEQYIYVLEVRFDKNMVVFLDDIDEDANKFPWCHSGTLFFLNYSDDYAEPDNDGCYEVFWVNDGTTLIVTGRNVGKAQMFPEDPEMAGVLVAGSKDGDTYYTEVAIPWATMATVSGFPAPSEGLKLRMTPIISAFLEKTSDTDDRFGEKWNQLNFYTDPDAGSPDDPNSNGGMILKGVNYTPPAEVVDDAPAANDGGNDAVEDAPVVVNPAPAPQTGDSILFASLMLMVSIISFSVILTIKNRKTNK